MVASFVELSPVACVTPVVPVGKLGLPEKEGDSNGAFKAKAVVTSVVFAFNAMSLVFAVILAVLAFTVLVSVVKSAAFAFRSSAAWVAVDIGLAASVVLSTDPNPTMDLVIPETVPVKVGDAVGAFKAKEVFTSAVFAFKANPGTVGAAAVPARSPAS